ncbi:EAL domain-containing protein [Pontixanthobacter sp.]|uniref:EAL domain-containing protein n=1 Tax=Pontixanthobacter sp. TaxID=2792078 RepID=UPI003C79FEA8
MPRDWRWVAAPAIAGMPLAAALAAQIPHWSVFIATALAIMAAFVGNGLAKREREGRITGQPLRIGSWIAILLPLGCSGFVFGWWAVHGGLAWPWALAGLVSVNAIAATLLNERVMQQFVGQLTSWAPIAFIDGRAEAFLAFTFATGIAALVGRHQARSNRLRTERSEARERERNRAEDILRDYEETGQGWFWETDRRGMLSYISPSIIAVTGRKETEILGRPFTDLFDIKAGDTDGERTLAFQMSARSAFKELGVKANISDEDRWWSVSGRPAYDGFHNFVGFRGSGTDLTEKKRSAENVNRLAQFDSLTGLANRFQMQETLSKILKAPQERHRECNVFLLDLDRFKHVNDTFGHPAGDALLKQVSERLTRAVGQNGRVGRLGGDEFQVIIPGRSTVDELAQLAHEIIHSLSQPYSISGQRVVIGASVGVARSPDDGLTSDDIIRNADLALYAAKDGGRGRYHFFSKDLHSAAEERSQLEEDLRDAIANGGLQLHYQPVVYAEDEVIAGFEALIRWEHPTKGWLSPAKFIPVAEDTGLVNAIGEWAIRVACDDLARWPENIRCAVNVSTVQFANPQLPSVITNAVANAGIHPSRLELEITESVFLNDNDGTQAMFAALKNIGVRLALDDFGTGYSSLGYLKKAPFNKIKIDQSFVRGATEAGSLNGAIISSITGLARDLGMDTTAEGVETLDELDLVRSLGCSHIQGYIYAKAMNSDAATALLQTGPKMSAAGPRSARAHRHTMLRKVVLETGGQYYNATIRNMSVSGALVEGLWNVPEGTEFNLALSEKQIVPIKTVWSVQERMGVRFAMPVKLDEPQKPSVLIPKKTTLADTDEPRKRA